MVRSLGDWLATNTDRREKQKLSNNLAKAGDLGAQAGRDEAKILVADTLAQIESNVAGHARSVVEQVQAAHGSLGVNGFSTGCAALVSELAPVVS